MRFEVLAVVTVAWDVKRSLVDTYQHFTVIWCLTLQGGRVKETPCSYVDRY
jgi:hypothetical protein